MTATDWLDVMTGELDELPPFADWLEEQDFPAIAHVVRTLPELATLVADALENEPTASHVEFRLAPEGSETPHGFRVLRPDGSSADGIGWQAHAACGLVAFAYQGGCRQLTAPALEWIECACCLVKAGYWSADPQGIVRARFRRAH